MEINGNRERNTYVFAIVFAYEEMQKMQMYLDFDKKNCLYFGIQINSKYWFSFHKKNSPVEHQQNAKASLCFANCLSQPSSASLLSENFRKCDHSHIQAHCESTRQMNIVPKSRHQIIFRMIFPSLNAIHITM